MAASPRSLSGLSRLVLISAAGLLILGLVILGLALRNAEAFAREEARGRANTTIEALHANLRSPRLLELLPDETRFRIQDGSLWIPEDLVDSRNSTEAADAEFREAALRKRLDRVQAGSGPAGVLQTIEEELDRPGLGAVSKLLLQNEGAWRAHIANLVARRDALIRAYEKTRKSHTSRESHEPIPLAVDRSAFLLRARAGLQAPDWSSELIPRLKPGEREALLDRARDLSPELFDRSQFQNIVAIANAAWARKDLLWRVRSLVGTLLPHTTPWYRVTGNQILIWYPGAESVPGEEQGEGSLLAEDQLLEKLRTATSDPDRASQAGLQPINWSGTLQRQPEAASGALPVWQGRWLMPDSDSRAGLGGQPWFLGLLFVVVFVLLIVGLWQILGSMKRERAAMVLRSEFLTSVTHELKTPVSSIRLFTEMLAEGRVSSEEKRTEYHRLLAGEATRLSALVENVLDLGRMERGERSYDKRSEDLVILVDEAVELFRPIAEGADMVIECDRPAAGRLDVSVDRTALMQTLLNLFENARKYARDGGVLLLRWETGDGEARLRVQDQGPGIALEERESVFERFRRGENQKDGAIPGVGLGLYLARRILRAHGGDLEAVDPPSDPVEGQAQGACLLLRLPLASDQPSSPSAT